MATIKELAVLIAEPLGRPLDDTFLAQLKDRIKIWRSRLLKNTLDKKPADRKFFTQTLTLKTEEVAGAGCPAGLNCKVWRTVEKVPLPVRANSILFDYVGSVGMALKPGDQMPNPFKLIKRWELPYVLANKYMPLVSSWYMYEDNYIYVDVPYVTIEAIWDDPEAVMLLSCDGNDCNTTEQEYPVSGEIAQLIVQAIQDELKASKPVEDNEINVS